MPAAQTAEKTAEPKLGFVCPAWAVDHWSTRECTVEPCSDGTFVVIEHHLQVEVYVAMTKKECWDWLK